LSLEKQHSIRWSIGSVAVEPRVTPPPGKGDGAPRLGSRCLDGSHNAEMVSPGDRAGLLAKCNAPCKIQSGLAWQAALDLTGTARKARMQGRLPRFARIPIVAGIAHIANPSPSARQCACPLQGGESSTVAALAGIRLCGSPLQGLGPLTPLDRGGARHGAGLIAGPTPKQIPPGDKDASLLVLRKPC
jgi:hypothetical protein